MNQSNLLSVAQWKSLIDQAFEAGMRRASLTGGECLTYPGFDEIYLHLISKGVRVSILTNGILLDRKRIDFLKVHRPACIHVSLYGSCNEIYEQVTGYAGFDTVWSNLQLVKQAELPLSISITPNRYMETDAEQLVAKAHSLHAPLSINAGLFEPRENTGRSGDNIEASIDTYIRMYKKQRELDGILCKPIDISSLPTVKENNETRKGIQCGAGMNSFQISWNGRMYPCTNLRLFCENPLADGFASCWNRISTAVRNIDIPSKCQDCPYEYICGVCIVPHIQNGQTGRCNPIKCQDAKRYAAEGIFNIKKEC